MSVLDRVVRLGEGRQLKRLQKTVTLTNSLEPAYTELTDEELRELTVEFRERLTQGEALEALMPEAFAAVREAATRTLGMRHFDVQILGGAALHEGNVAEMKTGEGKTLVATLPAYLNALTGRGVHIVTVNDYLASYQSELMGRVFRFLGMETGCILSGMTPEERREQYGMDITYGTNNEFGFDYLRDNMALTKSQLVHRDFHYAIVDEVDSILIDEARTPLIISGPATGDNGKWYAEFARIAGQLTIDEDYEVEEKKRAVGMLAPGVTKVEEAVGIENLYDPQNTPLISFLNNALKAKELFLNDREYVVQAGEVKIVDEHTGRLMAGRRYSDGLHQAIEAKEGVEVKAENQTYASVTLQNYFRLYDKLAGMTGTAQTEAAELNATYDLGVVPIPTNMPMVRADNSDLVYKNEAGKFTAVVDDIIGRQKAGQPVLVGTVSVEKSESLAKELRKRGIIHNVLNAKQHEKEAVFVAEAGRKGAVTIATNMAGRGTDIMLGGNPEFRAVEEMRNRGIDPQESPEEYEQVWDTVLHQAQAEVATEHQEVLAAGGLYVLGTERHDSRRIDNQLRGRSGRQGDPGESRFYLSLEDSLMRRFQQGLVQNMMNSGAIPDDMPIESKMLSRSIQSAQMQIEGQNAETRKNVLKYDDVMNQQRQVIYAERRRVLDGEDVHDQVDAFIDTVIGEFVRSATAVGNPEEWYLEALWKDLGTVYPVSVTLAEVTEEAGGVDRLSTAFLQRELVADARVAYGAVQERLGDELMRNVERQILLQTIDTKWREHLYEMDYLKEGIGLRAMGQRDPLMEYQREGFYLFEAMSDAVKQQTLQIMYRVRKREEGEGEGQPGQATVTAGSAAATANAAKQAPVTGVSAFMSASSGTGTGGAGIQANMGALTYSSPDEGGGTKVSRPAAGSSGARKKQSDGVTFPGTARNAQCPCGSGKKYKLCHGKNEE